MEKYEMKDLPELIKDWGAGWDTSRIHMGMHFFYEDLYL